MSRRKPAGYEGVNPYPAGVKTASERIYAGEQREEISAGLSKQEAITLGRALRKRMRGAGWLLRVWQNLGWHYAVHRGTVNVYVSHPDRRFPRDRRSYWTLMGGDGFGKPELTDPSHPHFSDPNKAVAAQTKFALTYIGSLQAMVDALLDDVKRERSARLGVTDGKRKAQRRRAAR